MSAIIARTGRDRQRYDENNLRLVSGCIPYRLAKDDEEQHMGQERRVEVLMVSSPNRDDMVFPKGGWENDETVEEAACREALEEAGVQGILQENLLGVWEFRSKSNQEVSSIEGGCKGYMYALEVTEELDDWPEQNNRERKWLSVREAFEVCRYEWMQSALEKFAQVMSLVGEEGNNAKNNNNDDNIEYYYDEEEEMTKEGEVVSSSEEEVLVVEIETREEADNSVSEEEVVVVVKDDDEDQEEEEECPIIASTNCHLNEASFGILLPPGISLIQ